MKTNQELYAERLERINKAIALEKPDKTPFVYFADSFAAKHTGYTIADFCQGVLESNKIIIESVETLDMEIDSVELVFGIAKTFPFSFMSNIKLPGRELPADMLWQIDEKELLLPEDYDTILKKGWETFFHDYIVNRLKIDVAGFMQDMGNVHQAFHNVVDLGYPAYVGVVDNSAGDRLEGGRSIAKYMKDLYKIPDKVEEVLALIQADIEESMRKQIRAGKPNVVFIAAARGSGDFYSPKLWERFIWKYIKATADMIIEEGVKVNFHLDANWGRDLSYFKGIPKGKGIIETDGTTDIYKIKEVLGSTMCIKGDVQAAKLALGTPEEVYNYSTRLIKDMGNGFILSSGCSIPPNAKIENVKAMISAAENK